MLDYHSIILWNSNTDLEHIIHQKFEHNIIDKIVVNLGAMRQEKIRQLYNPITLHDNDPRLFQNAPTTIFVLQLNPASHFEWRTEGYRLCNSTMLAFKKQYRSIFDYTAFHCTDNVLETQTVLDVFEIKNITPTSVIVPVDKLYHFIHEGESYQDTYENKKYRLVQIKNSPVVKYMLGDTKEYLEGNPLFNPREDSIEYHNSIPFTQSHEDCKLFVAKHNNNYVMLDGMHRSAVLYFKGDRHILAHYADAGADISELCKYISDDDFYETNDNTHIENFHKTIFKLNNAQIRYAVIRGFHHMPQRPNTDLDIVIHPQDFNRFITVMQELISDNALVQTGSKTYFNTETLHYHSYQTVGKLGDHLPNKCYQLDIYSDIFYFGENNTGIALSMEFREHLFGHIQKFHHINIPGIHTEAILLLCRVNIDKQGHWSDKHKQRALQLIHMDQFGNEEFLRLLHLATKHLGNKILDAGRQLLRERKAVSHI